jgi:hypothetical protein
MSVIADGLRTGSGGERPNPPSAQKGLRKVVLICALVAVLCLFVACGPEVTAEEATSLKTEISSVQTQIRSAEKEDANYSGGLIKSLIGVRIGILRQTEAMLQERSKAFTFGLALKFTIDGKPFVPPDSTNDLLRGVEQEIADNLARIRSQEAEAARYSGGLVQAMSLSTLATMRQTQAMLDQKRLALKYGLPQYVGFRSQFSQ